ncbi:MAG: hypothetical protein JW934_11770 [Anaerolineae bacterium]|nr:hypothetical protein [Anaerolineae bacterium]
MNEPDPVASCADEPSADSTRGDTIQVGPITNSIGVAIGHGAQSQVNILVSFDDLHDMAPAMLEPLRRVLADLGLSRPPVIHSAPASREPSGEALARNQAFVMFLGSDINGYLKAWHDEAVNAGIEDRLYVFLLPSGGTPYRHGG